MDHSVTIWPRSSMKEDDNGYYLYHGDKYVGFVPKDPRAYAEVFDPFVMRCRSAISALRRTRVEPDFKVSTN